MKKEEPEDELRFLCLECRESEVGSEEVLEAFQTEHFARHDAELKARQAEEAQNVVNHPDHYNDHPSGIECIEIVEHMNFCVGNAIKYLWRAGLKGDAIKDLKKAEWYIRREIDRLENS